MPHDDAMLRLALEVADGNDVDWAAASGAIPVLLRPIVDNLRAVSDIAHLVSGALATPPDTTAATATLWGRLELDSDCDTDGFYERYRARHVESGTVCSLRLLDVPGAFTMLERAAIESQAFMRMRMLRQLDVPGLVTVRGVDANHGRVGIWCDMYEVTPPSPPMDASAALALARRIGDALSALHHVRLVHGSIRPRTISVDNADPALDLPAPSIDPLLSNHYRTWLSWPECTFLAPELHTGGRATAATDVFGLAAIVVYMLTGELPYGLLTPDEWWTAVRNGAAPIPDATHRGDHVGRALEHALRPAPLDRPQTIGAFLRELGLRVR